LTVHALTSSVSKQLPTSSEAPVLIANSDQSRAA
jgi:hypothetical protein